MTQWPEGIETIPATELGQVVDVLCEAFHDYPVMRYVLGSTEHYDDQLRQLVHFFSSARVHRDELMLGIRHDDDWGAVALISYPGRSEEPASLAALREATWASLGEEVRGRYETFGQACMPLFTDEPHLHVNMIGTRRATRGTGLAGRLLRAVHQLSAADESSLGVSLSTEDPNNLPFYEHLGYEITGSATVSPELSTWAFFRPD